MLVRKQRFPVKPPRGPRKDFFGQPISQSQDQAPDYIYPAQLRISISSLVKQNKTEQKIPLAALYQLYKQQHLLDKQMNQQIQHARNKFRERTREIVDKTREIVGDRTTGVADFWGKVIKNSSFETLIPPKQIPIIDCITNLFANYNPTNKQITIEIHFSPNPRFKNQVIHASLTEKSIKVVEHSFSKLQLKKGFKTVATDSFFSVFTKVNEKKRVKHYEYWLNFVLKELPQAMAFYFEIREGTYCARIQVVDDEEEEEEAEEEEKVEEVVEEKRGSIFGNFGGIQTGGLFMQPKKQEKEKTKVKGKGKKIQKFKEDSQQEQEQEEEQKQEKPKSKSKNKQKASKNKNKTKQEQASQSDQNQRNRSEKFASKSKPQLKSNSKSKLILSRSKSKQNPVSRSKSNPKSKSKPEPKSKQTKTKTSQQPKPQSNSRSKSKSPPPPAPKQKQPPKQSRSISKTKPQPQPKSKLFPSPQKPATKSPSPKKPEARSSKTPGKRK